jgi:hypothetical protein
LKADEAICLHVPHKTGLAILATPADEASIPKIKPLSLQIQCAACDEAHWTTFAACDCYTLRVSQLSAKAG